MKSRIILLACAFALSLSATRAAAQQANGGTDLTARPALYFYGKETDETKFARAKYAVPGKTLALEEADAYKIEKGMYFINFAYFVFRRGPDAPATLTVAAKVADRVPAQSQVTFGAGEKTKLHYGDIRGLPPGPCKIILTVDYGDKVAETDEANNTFEFEVVIPGGKTSGLQGLIPTAAKPVGAPVKAAVITSGPAAAKPSAPPPIKSSADTRPAAPDQGRPLRESASASSKERGVGKDEARGNASRELQAMGCRLFMNRADEIICWDEGDKGWFKCMDYLRQGLFKRCSNGAHPEKSARVGNRVEVHDALVAAGCTPLGGGEFQCSPKGFEACQTFLNTDSAKKCSVFDTSQADLAAVSIKLAEDGDNVVAIIKNVGDEPWPKGMGKLRLTRTYKNTMHPSTDEVGELSALPALDPGKQWKATFPRPKKIPDVDRYTWELRLVTGDKNKKNDYFKWVEEYVTIDD